MKAMVLTAALMLGATAATAQSIGDCDWRASAQALAEPWEENTRTFSNGKTRLALLDTVEPAAGAFHLLILSPPLNELGERQCRVISYDGTVGFSNIEFSALEADYDPSKGLSFTLPVQFYHGGIADFTYGWMFLTLNQATGQIDASVHAAD